MDENWQVPDGFPYRLTDDELRGALDRMTAVPRTSKFASANTSLQAALIQVGVMEQSRRYAEQSSRSSRRIAWASVAVALLASLAAITFGGLDYFADKHWQDEQTTILREIRDQDAP